MTQARQLLQALQSATITLDILHKTRIGATVNSLRKSIDDPELVTISKDLIKKWKKLLDKDEAKKNGNNSPNINSTPKTSTSSSKNGDGQSIKAVNGPSVKESSRSSEGKESRSKEQSGASETSSEPRIKCRQLIANALKTPFLDGQVDEDTAEDLKELNIHTLAEQIAAQIEEHIFDLFKVTGPKYAFN